MKAVHSGTGDVGDLELWKWRHVPSCGSGLEHGHCARRVSTHWAHSLGGLDECARKVWLWFDGGHIRPECEHTAGDPPVVGAYIERPARAARVTADEE